jgi:hypothetical protein
MFAFLALTLQMGHTIQVLTKRCHVTCSHGWHSISSAEILSAGSIVSILLIRSLASLDTLCQNCFGNEYDPVLIFSSRGTSSYFFENG